MQPTGQQRPAADQER